MATMSQVAAAMGRYSRFTHFAATELFGRSGIRGHRAQHRKRKSKKPCPDCGATDLVYRWMESPWGIDGRWFCFCGHTEVDRK